MLERNTWILVADGSRARLFRNESPKVALQPALDHELIGENLPSRDLVTDREGRQTGSSGNHHALDRETDPKEHEKQRFLRDVAHVLENGLDSNSYKSLVVIAPPRALGELREHLDARVTARIVQEIPKDLTKDRVDALEARLREVFLPV